MAPLSASWTLQRRHQVGQQALDELGALAGREVGHLRGVVDQPGEVVGGELLGPEAGQPELLEPRLALGRGQVGEVARRLGLRPAGPLGLLEDEGKGLDGLVIDRLGHNRAILPSGRRESRIASVVAAGQPDDQDDARARGEDEQDRDTGDHADREPARPREHDRPRPRRPARRARRRRPPTAAALESPLMPSTTAEADAADDAGEDEHRERQRHADPELRLVRHPARPPGLLRVGSGGPPWEARRTEGRRREVREVPADRRTATVVATSLALSIGAQTSSR